MYTVETKEYESDIIMRPTYKFPTTTSPIQWMHKGKQSTTVESTTTSRTEYLKKD